ncbi:ribonuclease E/G [Mycobacterium sp. SM1]|uniref:Rne/Rng family ribonuclease n=1 Tax=Mycobacterium sp. SM1 TaxID=2816243 RepID=UPI001BCAE323|nr:Rne/Rng family ribonuclease [Mycobacterium sp. SM1]MBS4727190.1 ribonuclease E/G [Mycobacterium sp. SM1]
MEDSVSSSDLSNELTQREDLPDRLRVHSLARALGTTSQRVLVALRELDGRIRSAHSSVDRADAVRVRDLLAAGAEAPQSGDRTGPGGPGAAGAAESRPVVETTVERADYMPLFVAPRPIVSDEPDDADDSDRVEDSDAWEEQRTAGRRRRRGRRGRGRGRGDQGGSANRGQLGDEADAGTDDDDEAPDIAGGDWPESEEAGDFDEADTDEEDGAPETGSRRRRRRRRRKVSSGDDDGSSPAGPLPDDPPNTVVHERVPRTVDKPNATEDGTTSTEIQGINGSTRLEAKRQRRRDGRDAGRRRPPVLSEAEFLARREAVERVMVVRDKVRTEPPHQGERYTQIAVLEDGIVVEHFVTSAASASLVGNIYLGIVQNVLPSMEAAFVDIGQGRNGVLYAGEVNWEAAGLGGDNRKIEQALKPGDYVVVQVSKDPVGHKGARLTTQISLAGRYLVYVPGASSTGISRKLPDTERQRLKEILRAVVPPDAGVIIRTASEGVKEEDIRADITRLQERWHQIQAQAAEAKAKASGAAIALYEEPDVLTKVIRDLFNEDFAELIVSGEEAWTTINQYVNSVAPELVSKLTKYQPPTGPDGQPGPDVFAVLRIDEQLAKAMDRKVWLPSGGTLVIDRTEAMTVIDVNTGKFTGSGGNLEQTVTKNNLEAAEEIVRQLRLRDIGGIVVIDFIDMVLESNRDLVLRRLTEALARDRTRHQVSEVTSLGLVQLTRKRLGTGLIEAFSTPCPNCGGRGIIIHTDPVDSAQATGRKSESGGRRGRRSRRIRPDEPVVAKVPEHTPGEHPLFKAMAAAVGRRDGQHGAADEERADEAEEMAHEAVCEEANGDIEHALAAGTTEEALDEADEDGFDDVDEEEDEVELDDLGDDLELDDDLDLEDSDDEPDEEDASDETPADTRGDEGYRRETPTSKVTGSAFGFSRRRRAAVRPAGPPIHRD